MTVKPSPCTPAVLAGPGDAPTSGTPALDEATPDSSASHAPPASAPLAGLSRRAVLGTALGLPFAGVAHGQSTPADGFPAKPITLIVPFAPAGGTDIAARRLGEALGERLGQSVVIDNRPGANGVVAGQAVQRAAPDGHTLLVATAASFAAAPALGQKLPYDVSADFTPVGMLGLFPLVLNVAPDLPVLNLAGFLDHARSRPGALNYASAGVGGTNHLVFEMLMSATGIKLAHVPYRGAALAATDLMGGQVHAMIDSLAASLPNIRAGKLKALAVTTEGRQPQLAEVPTLKEGGVDLVYPGWASIVAPARTPSAVIAKLNDAMSAVLANDAIVARFRELVIEPAPWSPEMTGDFMAADRKTLTELVGKLGIKASE